MTDNDLERGQNWLKKLLQLLGVYTDVKGELEANFLEAGEARQNSYWLIVDESTMTPEQVQRLIGLNGSVLDATQYLANSILNINSEFEEQAFYTIEIAGYRVKRQAEVRATALSAAQQVRVNGGEQEIKSLSSAERRQIHSLLQEFPDLETFSRGKEPHRHLVVRLAQL